MKPLLIQNNLATRFLLSTAIILAVWTTWAVLMESDMAGFAADNTAPKHSSSTASRAPDYVHHLYGQDIPIRKWGCDRNETPLIFVHVGKAGGGQVRARFAAAAADYDRGMNWFETRSDHHYYPLPNDERAFFCNSLHPHHRFPDSKFGNTSFEGVLPCNATTPLGMALACPEPPAKHRNCRGCNRGENQPHCHSVYVGHNLMGSEFHWLPAQMLQRWWSTTGRPILTGHGQRKQNLSASSTSAIELLDHRFDDLSPHSKAGGCAQEQEQRQRPIRPEVLQLWYDRCGAPLAASVDAAVHRLHPEEDYSSWYASLPVHRTILLRDPWSWIVSKFYWHKLPTTRGFRCDDLSQASAETGWATLYIWTYLLYMCGTDCLARYDADQLTIEQAETQAANNLRQSMSVVGLLTESEVFYDMVSTRIAYVNMSQHPEVTGARHSSHHNGNATQECRSLYQQPRFQKAFQDAVPVMAALERLYELGVRVNRFQREELDACRR